jgi:pyruvate/2-oxoglutarate dehydrogenase complex dihydrolipoamide dehydrogenase (E3) component
MQLLMLSTEVIMETADVIVIGSGQGGVPLATDFAKAGQNWNALSH